jgi:rRNA maturation RNase YbeY
MTNPSARLRINFFKEDVKFRFENPDQLRKWIQRVMKKTGVQAEELNFIFCNDPYLKRLNKKYLAHNYFTDIITFENDIFISVDRVKENAKKFDATFKDELHRVMVHGVLHLAGNDDATPLQRNEMKKLEDYWLAKRNF